ncbi:MAG: alpha/beta hydrolase [Clostridia bacterium]|nr:alpha/beta hydrolase [Clostridia bacterium]
MKVINIDLSKERNSSLEIYLNAENNEFGEPRPRPFMLVIPGGGYGPWSETEAEPPALAYMAAGYQVGILRYTIKDVAGWPHPLDDYEMAMETVLSNADEWLIDKDHIAVIGFSAGGHLAACAATIAEHKPDAAVLVYPSIVREECDICQPGMPAPHEFVDRDTCPCFILAARDDVAVALSNALAMASALERAGIYFEMHIGSYGSHGFSTTLRHVCGSEVCPRLADWVSDSIEWLAETMGEFTINGFTEPVLPKYLPADREGRLTPDCSLAYVYRQPKETVDKLEPLWAVMKPEAMLRGYSLEGWILALEQYSIREVLRIHHCDDEFAEKIGNILREV